MLEAAVPRERTVREVLACDLLAQQLALQLAMPICPLHNRAIV
jgi:hypothetical protein